MRRSKNRAPVSESLRQWLGLRATVAHLAVNDATPKLASGIRSLGREFRYARPFQLTALLLVVVMLVVHLGAQGGVARSLNEVSYLSPNRQAAAVESAPELLARSVAKLRELAYDGSNGSLQPAAASKFNHLRSEFQERLTAVSRQFDADRAKLTALDADDALTRLDRVERNFDRGAERADRRFREVASSDTGPSRAGYRGLLDALDEVAPTPPVRALSSNLGFGSSDANPSPLTLSAGSGVAYGAPVPGLSPSALPAIPGAADLAETPETKVTPAISALAAELNHDPVRIYEYVRNKIEFVPYLGIRKGAAQTLAEESGSAADQSALTIALLRTSGIPARFVQGVAELPAAQVANWVGIDPAKGQSTATAVKVLAAGGIPTSPIRVNGDLQKVRFQHIWVETYVTQDAYRGVTEDPATRRWAPLDPSVKKLEFVAPSSNPVAYTAAEKASLQNRLQASIRLVEGGGVVYDDFDDLKDLATDIVSQKLEQVPRSEIRSGEILTKIAGKRIVSSTAAPYLPASLPFRTAAIVGEMRAVPSSLHAKVEVRVAGANPLSVPSGGDDEENAAEFTRSTAELAGKRVTVTYAPASAHDEEIVDAYHGLLNAPSYAASLVPVLRVDGRVVGSGRTPVNPGFQQRLSIKYIQPGIHTQTADNAIAVGGITALSLGLGRTTAAELDTRIKSLRKTLDGGVSDSNSLTDARLGALLGLTGDVYFQLNDATEGVMGDDVYARRSLSGALVATSVKTTYLGGFPVFVRLTGAEMDVDSDNVNVVSARSDGGGVDEYLTQSGLVASQMEARALDMTFGGTAAVSTTRILGEAAVQGVPVYNITPSTASEILPRLSLDAGTLADVQNALGDGSDVLIPARTITVGSWAGTGYIVSGESRKGYMISGALSGGALPIASIQLSFRDLVECLGRLPGAVSTAAFATGILTWVGAYFGFTVGLSAILYGALIVLSIAVLVFLVYLWMDTEVQESWREVLGGLWSDTFGILVNALRECTPA